MFPAAPTGGAAALALESAGSKICSEAPRLSLRFQHVCKRHTPLLTRGLQGGRQVRYLRLLILLGARPGSSCALVPSIVICKKKHPCGIQMECACLLGVRPDGMLRHPLVSCH